MQPAAAKEGHHHLAVGGARGRGPAVHLVRSLRARRSRPFAATATLPSRRSMAITTRSRPLSSAVVRKMRSPQMTGVRLPGAGQIGFPQDVVVGPIERQARFARVARARRAAPAPANSSRRVPTSARTEPRGSPESRVTGCDANVSRRDVSCCLISPQICQLAASLTSRRKRPGNKLSPSPVKG